MAKKPTKSRVMRTGTTVPAHALCSRIPGSPLGWSVMQAWPSKAMAERALLEVVPTPGVEYDVFPCRIEMNPEASIRARGRERKVVGACQELLNAFSVLLPPGEA